MSFVSIVARKNFITVMSDGRVTGSNGEALEEDCQKFVSTDDNKSFIAYAGTKQICEMISRDILPLLECGWTYQMIIQSLPEVFLPLMDQGKAKILMAIGGLNKENKIEFHTISSRDNKVNSYYLTQENDVTYAFLNNTNLSEQDFEDKVIELLRETGFDNPSKTIQAQKLLNNYIADNDSTVNKRTFRLSIRL